MARTDAEILGRDDVDDLDAILAVTNTDVDEAIHAVKDNADAIFTWDYEKHPPRPRQALREGQELASGTARPTCRGRPTVDRARRRRQPR